MYEFFLNIQQHLRRYKMKIKVFIATIIASIATLLAQTAVFGSFVWIFEEPKMPESLIKD